MSDIFREVDEDIRHEKYHRLWKRFGPWLLVVAVLIVFGTGGYRGWLYWQEGASQKAGDMFFDAVNLSEEGNFAAAEEKFAELNTSTGGYPALARLRAATAMAQSDRAEEALVAFDEIARDGSVARTLQDIALLRAGYIAADLEDYAAVAERVEGLSAPGAPFRAAAREILAVSAWKSGDLDKAQQWITALEEDAETPAEISRRVALLQDVIQSTQGSAQTADGGTAQ